MRSRRSTGMTNSPLKHEGHVAGPRQPDDRDAALVGSAAHADKAEQADVGGGHGRGQHEGREFAARDVEIVGAADPAVEAGAEPEDAGQEDGDGDVIEYGHALPGIGLPEHGKDRARVSSARSARNRSSSSRVGNPAVPPSARVDSAPQALRPGDAFGHRGALKELA